nr:hypothetical protein CFP56_59234 [Quercus suber]
MSSRNLYHETTLVPLKLGLKWTWLANAGPFITNGEVKESQALSSDTESDSVTVTMFNLDKLNDVRLEVKQGSTWEKGHISESPDSFIESLVQRVDRRRFRFELVESSIGLGLLGAQA